ncbi:MAG: PAS domain S-box protein [Desulfobacteraceae bacterium]|jgi:PAS domain S-box-containing protein|nr:MAG: PAS domain S-box protein [Desulfobacteraceae bacterium]
MAIKPKSERQEQRLWQLAEENSALKRRFSAGTFADDDLAVFKQAVEASSDAVGMSTAEGLHYYQNKSFDELFGNIGNDPPSTLYIEASVGREVFAAIMGGRPWNGEVEMRARDGSVLNILLRAYPIKDEEGTVRRIVGVHTNITERKKTENELRLHREHLEQLVEERTLKLAESEERFRQMAENIQDIFYLYAADYTTVHYVSPGFEKITGYKPDRLYNAPWFFLEQVHEHDRQAVRNHKQKILSSKNFSDTAIEYRILTADGNIIWLKDEMFPVYKDQNHLIRIAGTARDITRRKAAEEGFQRSREKLRNLSGHLQRAVEEERKRIAREIHDDLGQTLIALKMSLSALRKRSSGHNALLTETITSAEETIDQMIRSIRVMISDLRAGPLSDLGLEAAIEWLTETLMKRSHIKITIKIDTNEFEIDPDREIALFRITQEALNNIVKHSGATEISINLFVEDTRVHLLIKDNGSGMADTDELPAGTYGIMGMRERIHFYGGNLSITSEPENGTLIAATIPLDVRQNQLLNKPHYGK